MFKSGDEKAEEAEKVRAARKRKDRFFMYMVFVRRQENRSSREFQGKCIILECAI